MSRKNLDVRGYYRFIVPRRVLLSDRFPHSNKWVGSYTGLNYAGTDVPDGMDEVFYAFWTDGRKKCFLLTQEDLEYLEFLYQEE